MKQPNPRAKVPELWKAEHVTTPRKPWYESESCARNYYRMKINALHLGGTFYNDRVSVSKLLDKPFDRKASFLVNGRWYRSLDTAVNAILQIVASSVHERAA